MLDVAMVAKIVFLLNPLASVPLLFLAYKKQMNVKKIAFQSILLAFAVAILFLFIGPFLFDIYGINISSFRAAGGVVTILLGLSMARGSEEKTADSDSAVISIIAAPLLTGPATLSFLILTAKEITIAPVLLNLLIAFAVVSLIFIFFAYLIPNINLQYVDFASRLLGLFILALGIEMLANGAIGLLIK